MNFIRYYISSNKFKNTSLKVLLISLCLALSCLMAVSSDLKLGIIYIGGIIGLAILLVSVANPRLGFYLIICLAFVYAYPKRISPGFALLPTGTFVTVLTYFSFLSLLVRNILFKENIWSGTNKPITIIIITYTVYLLIEAVNPSNVSLAGWLAIYPLVLAIGLFYYTAIYVFRTREDIYFFIKFWFCLAMLVALYGCYQQWFGLPTFEYNWVASDSGRFGILFQAGQIRKFSFLPGPVTFGIFMTVSAVFFLILSLGNFRPRQKFIMVAGSMFMLLGMAYSGTRTAVAILPIGLLMYGLLTIRNKKTFLFLIIAGLAFLLLLYIPIYNGTMTRFRSAFRISNDASYNVRDMDRHHIQPYIYKHPIGGGLATTDVMGEKYSPGHPLAGFPPDSGLLNLALETGYIGFIINLIFYYILLRTGIKSYFRTSNPRESNILAALLSAVFAWLIANYAQEATSLMPCSLFFYVVVAIIHRFDIFTEAESSNLVKES